MTTDLSRWFPVAFTVNIGDDGGKLTFDQREPVVKYWINGEPATEAGAWEWIARWHLKRDEALGAGPCQCPPCSWWRDHA